MSKAAIISAMMSNHDFMKNLVHATFVAEGKKGLKIVPCENHSIETIPSLYGKRLVIENIKPADLISVINGCGHILKPAIFEAKEHFLLITGNSVQMEYSTYEQLQSLKAQLNNLATTSLRNAIFKVVKQIYDLGGTEVVKNKNYSYQYFYEVKQKLENLKILQAKHNKSKQAA